MRLNLRQVEAFKATFECGSVTGASELLHITQPAVSRLLADMAVSVGFQLFERRGRGLTPTRDAELLYLEVARSFAGLGRIADVARAIKDHAAGTVRVIALPAYADGFLAKVIGGFLKDNPGIVVELESGARSQVMDGIIANTYDLGLMIETAADPVLEMAPLFESGARLAMPPDDPLAGLPVVPLSALQGRRFVALPSDSPFFAAITKAMRQQAVVPWVVGQARTQRALCQMVAAGAGLALVDAMAAVDSGTAGLVFKPLEPAIPWTACTVLNSRVKPAGATLTFRDVLRESCRQAEPGIA